MTTSAPARNRYGDTRVTVSAPKARPYTLASPKTDYDNNANKETDLGEEVAHLGEGGVAPLEALNVISGEDQVALLPPATGELSQ